MDFLPSLHLADREREWVARRMQQEGWGRFRLMGIPSAWPIGAQIFFPEYGVIVERLTESMFWFAKDDGTSLAC